MQLTIQGGNHTRGIGVETARKVILLLSLYVMARTDYREHKVKLEYVAVVLAAGIITGFAVLAGDVGAAGFSAADIADIAAAESVGIVMLIISYITGGRVGMGDAVIFLMTGVFLGFWGNVQLLMLSLYMAGVAALVLLLIIRKDRNAGIAFVPFVFASYTIMLAW